MVAVLKLHEAVCVSAEPRSLKRALPVKLLPARTTAGTPSSGDSNSGATFRTSIRRSTVVLRPPSSVTLKETRWLPLSGQVSSTRERVALVGRHVGGAPHSKLVIVPSGSD